MHQQRRRDISSAAGPVLNLNPAVLVHEYPMAPQHTRQVSIARASFHSKQGWMYMLANLLEVQVLLVR
jgi:hypothetical protein